MRYDLIVGDKVIGVISLVERSEDQREHWLLELDAFGNLQVSVKFVNEHEAHHMAEEWANAQQRVDRLADTMRRSGIEFTIR